MKLKTEHITSIYDSDYTQYQVLKTTNKPKAYTITYDGLYVRIKLVSSVGKVKWLSDVLTIRMCNEYVKKLNELFNTDKFKREEI